MPDFPSYQRGNGPVTINVPAHDFQTGAEAPHARPEIMAAVERVFAGLECLDKELVNLENRLCIVIHKAPFEFKRPVESESDVPLLNMLHEMERKIDYYQAYLEHIASRLEV